MYYGRIPITNPEGELKANYNLYLKNDPRTLRDIPINGTINLGNDWVFLSLDNASDSGCTDRESIMSLAQLITGTGHKLEVVFNDIDLAKAKNKSYMTCENSKERIVLFKAGNETKITQKGNCYELEFKDCEIRTVTERFIVGWIANSKGLII
jgi:hypothetical protein